MTEKRDISPDLVGLIDVADPLGEIYNTRSIAALVQKIAEVLTHVDETLGLTETWLADCPGSSAYESGPTYKSVDVTAGLHAFREELKLSYIVDLNRMFDDAKLLSSVPDERD